MSTINGINKLNIAQENIKSNNTQKTDDSESTYSGFKGFAKSNAGDTIDITTKTGTTSNISKEEAKAKEQQAKADIAEGRKATSDGKAQASSSKESVSDNISEIQANKTTIDEQTNIANTESANMQKSNSALKNIHQNQDKISDWIATNSPNAEEMKAKVDELTEQAFGKIADVGIKEEFGTLEDAMNAINEMIDPDALKQIEEKQAEKAEKEEEMNSLPDDDPRKEELKGEIETLDGEIASLNTTDSGIEMTVLQDLMTELTDISDSIGILNEQINAYHEDLASNVSTLDNLDSQTKTEANNAKQANQNLNNAITTTTQAADNIENKNTVALDDSNTLIDSGQVVQYVGMGLQATGAILSAIPYTATVGGIMEGVGTAANTAGREMVTQGNQQLERTNNEKMNADNSNSTFEADSQTTESNIGTTNESVKNSNTKSSTTHTQAQESLKKTTVNNNNVQ